MTGLKKRGGLFVLLLAFALIVAACSSDSDDTTTTAAGGEETTTTAAEETTTTAGGEETTTTAGEETTTTEAMAFEGEPIKTCLVTDLAGVDDRSFNASAWAGVQAAMEGGYATDDSFFLESTDASDWQPNIDQMVEPGLPAHRDCRLRSRRGHGDQCAGKPGHHLHDGGQCTDRRELRAARSPERA